MSVLENQLYTFCDVTAADVKDHDVTTDEKIVTSLPMKKIVFVNLSFAIGEEMNSLTKPWDLKQ